MKKAWSFEPAGRPTAAEMARTIFQNGGAIIESATRINASAAADSSNNESFL